MTDLTTLPQQDTLPDITFTETGWQPTAPMTFDQWENAGRILLRMGRAWKWWAGDWVLYGERTYGDRYSQALEVVQDMGVTHDEVARAIHVAEAIGPERRRLELSWSHHAEVADLPAPEQDEWLDRAASERMTVARLRAAMKHHQKGDPIQGTTPAAPVEFKLTGRLSPDCLAALKSYAERLGGTDLVVEEGWA